MRRISLARRLEGLTEDLFPLSPAIPPRPFVALIGVAGVGLLIVLSLLRQAGVSPLDTVWAEDGVIFLAPARLEPLSATLFRQYAGYYHFLPRVLAEVAAAVPIGRAASALALLAALTTAGCALLVFVATGGHLRSRPSRAVLAASVVLLPLAAIESLNSIALVQWHLAFAAFWASLWRPQSGAGKAVGSLVLAVTVLSAPLALVFAPVLLLRLLATRAWRDRLPVLAFATCALIQVYAVATGPGGDQAGGAPRLLAKAYARGVAEPTFLGFRLAESLRLAYVPNAVVTGLALAAVLAVVLVGIARDDGVHRLTLLLAAGTSLVTFAVAVYQRGMVSAFLAAPSDGNLYFGASRYAIVPALLLLSVLVLALDDWKPNLVVLGFLLVIAGMDFFVQNGRSSGPAWSAEVAAAVERCRTGAASAELQVSPAELSGFTVPMPCDELLP